jgi:hypothetical protein
MAARLVDGLAHDFPDPNERPEIKDLHLSAINVFSELAASLQDATNRKQQQLWDAALAAVHDWLRALSALNSDLHTGASCIAAPKCGRIGRSSLVSRAKRLLKIDVAD